MKPTARRDNVLVERLDGETIVYDLAADKAHLLNRAAALVWERCDGDVSVAELAEAIRSETGLPADDEVVHLALRQLQQANLLQDAAGPPVPAAVSRRQLMRRLGIAAGFAFTLPLVKSVTAPTPAFAQSVADGAIGANGADISDGPGEADLVDGDD
jgi:hypothetical protein